ncbi:DUF4767 domain-containing protein [Paucilactobacillus nenjiangensis]|uniref:DUF4767 domain-containing protein n=1 Tax=Paucilactobacillus nenjiangensis TaxID=1296540 RepID=UPI003FA2A847
MKQGSSKNKIIGWIIGVVVVIVVAFGGYRLFYSNGNGQSKGSETSSSKQTKTYWNSSKDKKLKNFMNEWDDGYQQATRNHQLDYHQISVPKDIKTTSFSMNDKEVTAEWSKRGTGTKDYEIVAAYTNYDSDVDNANLYLFTIHNDAPTILQTSSTSEKLKVTTVHDEDLLTNFEKVVDGKTPTYRSSSSADSESSGSDSSQTKVSSSGLSLTEIAANNFSSLVGTWKNDNGETIEVTNQTMDKPAGTNWALSKGAVLANSKSSEYPDVIGGGNMIGDYMQGAYGTFDPQSMSMSPIAIVPAGVKATSADDSDSSRDRLISGGGQGGYATEAYYRE